MELDRHFHSAFVLYKLRSNFCRLVVGFVVLSCSRDVDVQTVCSKPVISTVHKSRTNHVVLMAKWWLIALASNGCSIVRKSLEVTSACLIKRTVLAARGFIHFILLLYIIPTDLDLGH